MVGGAGDQPAGAVGNGIVRSGHRLGHHGHQRRGLRPQPTSPCPTPRATCSRSATPCRASGACSAACSSAGGSLQWLRNTLFGRRGRGRSARRKKDPGELYPEMIEEAAEAPAGCEGLVFLPYLTGERCPYPDPTARGAWVGLTVRHRRAHLIRVGPRRHHLRHARPGRDHAAAAACRSPRCGPAAAGRPAQFWRQMQADMYNAKVVTINTREGGALGVALLAAVGTGEYSSVPEACKAAIRVTETLKPNKAGRALRMLCIRPTGRCIGACDPNSSPWGRRC